MVWVRDGGGCRLHGLGEGSEGGDAPAAPGKGGRMAEDGPAMLSASVVFAVTATFGCSGRGSQGPGGGVQELAQAGVWEASFRFLWPVT